MERILRIPAMSITESARWRSVGKEKTLVESVPHPKENAEITSGCLQSVDDLEATYRTKGTGHYKGYVANITETCDPENELQLITKVQVAPNNVDDTQLLADALPNLKERTGVKTMILTAKRRKEYLTHKGDGHNLRFAVEATVRSVKHPFPTGKMPVRGQFRVTCLAIASAATTNVRRIQRYLVAKTKAAQATKITKDEPNNPSNAAPVSFSGFLQAQFGRWLCPAQVFCLIVVC